MALKIVTKLLFLALIKCGEGKGHPYQCSRVRLHAHKNLHKIPTAKGSVVAARKYKWSNSAFDEIQSDVDWSVWAPYSLTKKVRLDKG